MKALVPLLLALALVSPTVARTPFAQSRPLALRGARLSGTTVPRYERLELTLDLSATYDNPFDPAQIDVYALFTPPRGKPVRVNGFLDEPFTRALRDGAEVLRPAGPPVWRVRFTPNVAGPWHYRVFARDRTGTASLPAAAFRVTPSASPGFVRVSRVNPHVFAYDTGAPCFLVGENVCWAGRRGTYDFDDWLGALGKAGGNGMRLWMHNDRTTLEWTPAPGQTGEMGWHGLGVYSLDRAWEVDKILDIAARNHIAVMLCLGTYSEFTTGGFFGEGAWNANPYNKANGGPCATPADFWTNPDARRLYRQRLRYLAARYGDRTNLQSWELWNETDAPAPWVAEMAGYLKRVADPYRHLVSTTYGTDAVWKLPDIDFTLTHNYGTGNIADHAPVVHGDALQYARYGKPHLMSEFGIDWRAPDSKYDPHGLGVNLHNGLWAGALSGDAGGAMLWWWDNYVHPEHVYAPFTAVRRFTERAPWTAGVWKPLPADPPRVASGPETFTDLDLTVFRPWGKDETSDFTLGPSGVAGGGLIPGFLYGPAKADLRTTPTFHVRFTRPGRFVVRVDTVSDRAHLRFLLDGKPVLDRVLSAAPPMDPGVKPEYESTDFKQEYKVYQAHFGKDYAIDIPAGAHTITLENTEGDWASLERITLTGYRSSRDPQMNLYGLTDGRMAVLWAQNALHNWKNVADGKPIPVITGAATVLHGLPAGRYQVEWWDTARGVVARRTTASSAGGVLRLPLPDIATDAAVRITPVAPVIRR